MEIKAPCIITARLLPGVKIGKDSFVSITYAKRAGREGRTRYQYYIDAPNFKFEADDLQSGAGGGELADGLKTLLAFLGAAGEAYRYSMSGRESDNADMFPPKVMEWCYQHDNEITGLQFEIEEMLTVDDSPIDELAVNPRKVWLNIPRALKNYNRDLKRYSIAARQSVGAEREKYQMAVRNLGGAIAGLERRQRKNIRAIKS